MSLDTQVVDAEQLIVKHLDLWTSAQTAKSTAGRGSNNKIELTGIKKLRELILELAVRGRLVQQDPTDEPASDLIKRIEANKEALIKAGKLKKQKLVSPISEDNLPFNIPKGWTIAKLQQLVTILGDGLHGTPAYDSEGKYYFVNGNNLCDGYIAIKPETKKVNQGEYLKFRKDLNERTVLASINGTIGNVAFYNDEPIVLGKSACYFNLDVNVSKSFIKLIIQSPYFHRYASTTVTGSTIKNLGLAAMNSLPVVLPPLNEQNRIVAKVEELMALCDQLEQQSYQSIDAHNQLVDTLLQTLVDSADADELVSNWQRLSEHFDTLFTTEYSIDALKQTILQLAVMGKLVKQDPTDEPASELLKRIAKEKEALVKAGKIKKQKPLPSITDDEKPFALPEGWMYVRLNQLGSFSGGKTPSKAKAEYWKGSIPWVSPKDMKSKAINDSEDHVSESAIANGLELLPAESILIVVRSGILRRTLPVAVTKVDCTINQDIKALKLHTPDMAEYVLLMLSGFEKFILSALTKTGTTVESVKVEEFINQGFILPPKSEQERIIATVNELMLICDTLSRKLEVSKQTKTVLAETFIRAVVA